jgi:sugar/nucleoside kinase (ribokinase family)
VSVAATSIKNPVLVVGSVALDSVETPFGKADEVLGGSGTYFSSSASHFTPVQLVGVVGDDYPVDKLEPLAARGVDLAGLEKAEGTSFRWRGRYRHDLNSAETLETHLGVFSHFRPKIPEQFRHSPFVFLANIDPRLQLQVLEQVEKPRLVACDTMNFWIESRRPEVVELLGHVDLITLNDAEARQLTEHTNLVQAARWIMDKGPKHVLIKKGEHGAFMFTREHLLRARVPAGERVRSHGRRRLVCRGLHWLSRRNGRSERAQHAPRGGRGIGNGLLRGGEVLQRAPA